MEIKLIPKFDKVRITPQTDLDVFNLGKILQKNNLSYSISFKSEGEDVEDIDHIDIDIYKLWACIGGDKDIRCQ